MKKEPRKIIRQGSVEIKIYDEPAGYRVTWYEAGERKRKFLADAEDAVSFAKRPAGPLAKGDVSPAPATLEDLKYLGELRARLAGVPVHVAVDYYVSNHRAGELVDAKISDLFP